MEETIAARSVAYDLARLIEGATQVPCSVFGQVITSHCDEAVGHPVSVARSALTPGKVRAFLLPVVDRIV
jgi:hypothetical protein